jgi:hypothetical protein
MFVSERVRQDERVEPVVFHRSHPVTFAGPGGDPRRHREDQMAAFLQALDQQPLRPLDRDRDRAGELPHLPVQLGQASDIMAHPDLSDALPRPVHDAQLMMLAAPVDSGEMRPALNLIQLEYS